MDMVNGSIRVRAWPRKRGRSGTPKQQANRDKFASVQRASRYIAPQTYSQIVDATQGTPLLPRDIVTMIMYNRVAAFTLPDGRTLYPMAVRKDVSEALDSISQTEGDTLVRGPEGWIALPYGGGGGTAMRAACCYLPNDASTSGAAPWYPNFSAVAYDPEGWLEPNPGYFTPNQPGLYLLILQGMSGYEAFYGGAFQINDGPHEWIGPVDWDGMAGVGGVELIPLNGTTDKVRAGYHMRNYDPIIKGQYSSSATLLGPVSPL